MNDNGKLLENEIGYDEIDSKIAELDSTLTKMNDRLKAINENSAKNKARSSTLERKMHIAIISIALLLISTVNT